ARLVALDRQALVALPAQRGVDLLGEGVDLAAAGAGGDHEVVVEGGLAAHVQDEDVAGLVVGGDLGAQASTFQGDAHGRGREASHGCGAQWTSFWSSDPAREVRQRSVRGVRGANTAFVGNLRAGINRPQY